MKFSDLHDPAAAAKLIQEFKQRFSSKVCLAPSKDCEGGIISAHTLSVEAMLRPISRDGHVYALDVDLFNPPNGVPVKVALKGLRDTSVFNGFCAKHDKELFAPIENEHFICSAKQLFMHAYRAVAKECYVKRRQADFTIPIETMRKIHGWADDLKLEESPETLLIKAVSLLGAEEIEGVKSKLDQYYIESSWSRVVTTVVPFSKSPTILCNFVFAPDFDLKGNLLQNFEDETIELSHLMVTIFPYNKGGFVFLSHLDTANSAPRDFVQSFVKSNDISSSLVTLATSKSENIAISPIWYEGLTPEKAKELMVGLLTNADPYEQKISLICDSPIRVESWEPGKPFTI